MNKILITGANGFIGSHMADYIENYYYDFYTVVGTGRGENKYNRRHYIEADLLNYDQCLEITKGIDIVLHFAADMGGIAYIKGERQGFILRNNAVIDMNILHASLINGVKKFLFTSSSCAYPKHTTDAYYVAPMNEEMMMPAEPENGYGWAKLLTEQACRLYSSYDGSIETRVARLFSTFGPRMEFRGDRAKSIMAFIRKVIEAEDGSEVEMWGTGERRRCYMYVDNVIDGLFKLMESNYRRPVNIGNEISISIKELMEKIIAISGKNLRIKHVMNGKEFGVKGRRCDATKAHEILKWQPFISLDDGIKKTYDWVKEQMEND